MQIRAFECNVRGEQWHKVYNHVSAGKAKAEYLRQVRDSWESVRYVDITVRAIGPAQTSEGFLRNCEYRGVSWRCGDRVRVGEDLGALVGHNSSANFDVLFETGKYAGQVLNVHPGSIQLAENG